MEFGVEVEVRRVEGAVLEGRSSAKMGPAARWQGVLVGFTSVDRMAEMAGFQRRSGISNGRPKALSLIEPGP